MCSSVFTARLDKFTMDHFFNIHFYCFFPTADTLKLIHPAAKIDLEFRQYPKFETQSYNLEIVLIFLLTL